MRKQSMIDHLHHEPFEWKMIGEKKMKGFIFALFWDIFSHYETLEARRHATELY